ncbi:response regulator [Rhizobium leguminosarum]|uniref:response regulator n=1 Tax=Rhizobium leguminosarum TaxID=384 RepID=UPI001FDF5346|nr:response regulator [Rhizobium leguminosarum]
MQKAVLVVEDEALIRFVAVDVLEDDGYVVYQAGSVLEAVGILSSREIDVLFTDVDMPGGLTGVDLARLVAGVYPKIGILVTSGRYHLGKDVLPAGGRFLPKRTGRLDIASHPSFPEDGEVCTSAVFPHGLYRVLPRLRTHPFLVGERVRDTRPSGGDGESHQTEGARPSQDNSMAERRDEGGDASGGPISNGSVVHVDGP